MSHIENEIKKEIDGVKVKQMRAQGDADRLMSIVKKL